MNDGAAQRAEEAPQTQEFDRVGRAAVTIGDVHRHVHALRSYHAFDTIPALASAATAKYLLTAGAKDCHITLSVTGTLVTTVALHEHTTHGGGGTIRVGHNRSRSTSVPPATMEVRKNPTAGGVDGTKFHEDTFGLAAGGGPNAAKFGGSSSDRSEWVLPAGDKMYLVVTSGTADNRIAVLIDWYEVTP